MSDNVFIEQSFDLVNDVDTYTDHPAYQTPLNRTELHNNLRNIAGWCVIILSFLMLLSCVGFFLYVSYQFISSVFIQAFEHRMEIVMAFIKPILGCVGGVIALHAMRWGRHLTRPNSREYV